MSLPLASPQRQEIARLRRCLEFQPSRCICSIECVTVNREDKRQAPAFYLSATSIERDLPQYSVVLHFEQVDLGSQLHMCKEDRNWVLYQQVD